MDVIALAKTLIDQDTTNPPGNEEKCARVLRDYIEDLHLDGCSVELHEFETARANLLVKVGPDVPGLVLSGHLDVVPAGDLEKWKSGPFEAEVRNGRLFGRGAVDMKTTVAAMVGAMHSFKGSKLKRRFVLAATADEEVSCKGLKSMLKQKKLGMKDAVYCVVGEPSQMIPARAHRGVSAFKVKFMGRSAHASRPDLGVNAVEKCAEFIVGIEAWEAELKKQRNEDLGLTVISSTVVRGGTKSNVIPEYCEMEINSRRIPEHSHQDITRGLEKILKNVMVSEKDLRAEIETTAEFDPLLIPKGYELVKLVEDVSGKKAVVVPYGTEAPLYSDAGIPAVILGPGSIEVAHTPNEYIALDQVSKAIAAYSEVVRRVCV
jgi:acetylornithine deacetylase ArgE